MTDDMERRYQRWIASAPLALPREDQYVDRCWFSRTGWAIHTADGICLCTPAAPPNKKGRPKPAARVQPIG